MQSWVRLARYTVEKPILDKHPEAQWFAVPANILAFYSSSLSLFMARMNRHYFVDPLTHQFQFPESFNKSVQQNMPDGSKQRVLAPKGSFEKLFKAYGPGLVGQKTILNTLSDEVELRKRVGAILEFQLSALHGKSSKKQKYAALAGEAEMLTEPEPDFLIAPYFYFQNTSDAWFDISKRCLALARELYPQRQVYCVICFEKRLLLDDNACQEISRAFPAADGYLLLVSDFDEQRESIELLSKFRSFAALLASQRKPVINLYGQYFSVLLRGTLSGVSFGLCVNETRDVTRPTQAGRITIRFYQKKLHIKLREPQAREFILKYIGSTDCACKFCKDMRTLMSINTSERSRLNAIAYVFKKDRGTLLVDTIEHFLRTRSEEMSFVSSNEDAALKTIVRTDAADVEANGYSLIVDASHLGRWVDSL